MNPKDVTEGILYSTRACEAADWAACQIVATASVAALAMSQYRPIHLQIMLNLKAGDYVDLAGNNNSQY